jgi:hypothetical protein
VLIADLGEPHPFSRHGSPRREREGAAASIGVSSQLVHCRVEQLCSPADMQVAGEPCARG